MPQKRAPLGICDLCGESFPTGVSVYTAKRGTPRLFCSPTCRATANSRAGAAIRSRKGKERVRQGEWRNPLGDTPEEVAQALRARNTSPEQRRKVAAARRREVEAGEWCNPAHTPEARQKLSRPRRHTDSPVLHSAREKLRKGLRITELTLEEAEEYRRHRRELRAGRRAHWRAYYRDRYRRWMSTPAGREKQRQKWARQRERNRARGPNQALRRARERAGYSQRRLAELVGVAQTTLGNWERDSSRPSDEPQQRVAELLGVTVEEIFDSKQMGE